MTTFSETVLPENLCFKEGSWTLSKNLCQPSFLFCCPLLTQNHLMLTPLLFVICCSVIPKESHFIHKKVERTKSLAVIWPIYRLKGREGERKGQRHQTADSYWNKWIKMDCSCLVLLNRTELKVCFCFFLKDCKLVPVNRVCVCMHVREKERMSKSSREDWRYEVVWSERQPRQDISGLVNHLRDIYYSMAGSLSKADCSLESLLQNEMLTNPTWWKKKNTEICEKYKIISLEMLGSFYD